MLGTVKQIPQSILRGTWTSVSNFTLSNTAFYSEPLNSWVKQKSKSEFSIWEPEIKLYMRLQYFPPSAYKIDQMKTDCHTQYNRHIRTESVRLFLAVRLLLSSYRILQISWVSIPAEGGVLRNYTSSSEQHRAFLNHLILEVVTIECILVSHLLFLSPLCNIFSRPSPSLQGLCV